MTKLCLAVMAFLCGKGKQWEETQQNATEEKIVDKATCYFYGQEKIRPFIQTLAHFGFTKQSPAEWLVRLDSGQVTSSPMESRYLLSHVPWLTFVPPSCMFDMMYVLSSGTVPTHISMARDLCIAGAV